MLSGQETPRYTSDRRGWNKGVALCIPQEAHICYTRFVSSKVRRTTQLPFATSIQTTHNGVILLCRIFHDVVPFPVAYFQQNWLCLLPIFTSQCRQQVVEELPAQGVTVVLYQLVDYSFTCVVIKNLIDLFDLIFN